MTEASAHSSMDRPRMLASRVAIFFQALPPPLLDGLRKAAKPGGYSDSGADIGFALSKRGAVVVTPEPFPDPASPLDWVFPDTAGGLQAALGQGADVLWANTVLFEGHPLERRPPNVAMVGQTPADTQRFDQKFDTNRLLLGAGLPVASSILVALHERTGICALNALSPAGLVSHGLVLPLVVKPVRGRGSQGVRVVRDMEELTHAVLSLLRSGGFGDTAMIEAYLPGDEMTVTVLPPSAQPPGGAKGDSHWCLRPVLRFDQHEGVAPYNGDVPVAANSIAISAERLKSPEVGRMLRDCARAARCVGAKGLIRIDCRADADGVFQLFDLNMKPNMTGPGRPGRENEACLSAIAAQADGWSYSDLVEAMLSTAWT